MRYQSLPDYIDIDFKASYIPEATVVASCAATTTAEGSGVDLVALVAIITGRDVVTVGSGNIMIDQEEELGAP